MKWKEPGRQEADRQSEAEHTHKASPEDRKEQEEAGICVTFLFAACGSV